MSVAEIPSSSSRSNDPEVDEALLFPCLQTLAPAPVATKDAIVDTFSAACLPIWDPPAPTRSIVSSGQCNLTHDSLIAFTKPVTS